MKTSYISLVTSDDYLPGILALCTSLRRVKSAHQIAVLVTDQVSPVTRSSIVRQNACIIPVNAIDNPTDVDPFHRWCPTYSKLHCFALTQFDKIVYLDADTLVLSNIDELFHKPHMAATNTGSMLQKCKNWTGLNSGVLVIEPSTDVFVSMCSKIGSIEPLQSGGTREVPRKGSDQDFLNSFFPDWKSDERLHLDHKYNMIHYLLDSYSLECGYTLSPGEKQVAVLHFASSLKPWNCVGSNVAASRTLEAEALRLWAEIYREGQM